MTPTTIRIPVDVDVAQAFAAASPEARRKMQLLLSLRLRELTTSTLPPLKDLMNTMASTARARGLTPEILEQLLQDDDE
jgi:hypothetical protein